MQKIVVDAALRDQLLAVRDVAELQDGSGRVIGRFVAAPSTAGQFADDDFPSDEELDRRMREGRSFSADEVMERLRSLRRMHREG